MSTIDRRGMGAAYSKLEQVVILLFAPALLIHEGAHWIVGSRWALESEFIWNWREGQRPHVISKFPAGTEYWKIVLTQISPAITALLLAPAFIAAIFYFGLLTPMSIYLMASWAGIALLSPEDLSVLRWDMSNQEAGYR